MTQAPGYQSNFTHIVLAQDLYEASAEGDEPEPLEVVEYKLSELESLVYNEDLTEARSIAALYMAKEIIRKQNV
jgi:ADP-ribose diphosphatase